MPDQTPEPKTRTIEVSSDELNSLRTYYHLGRKEAARIAQVDPTTLNQAEQYIRTAVAALSPPAAYVVTKASQEGGKDRWTGVGVVWPHRNGTGFDIVLHEQISVSGRIVCVERKEREDAR